MKRSWQNLIAFDWDSLLYVFRGLLLPKIVVDDFGGTRSDAGMLGSGIYFASSARLGSFMLSILFFKWSLTFHGQEKNNNIILLTGQSSFPVDTYQRLSCFLTKATKLQM